MIYYELQFNDGEHICYKDTLKEAEDYRSKHNFEYISRSIHIYATLCSKVINTKLFNHPITYKIM